MNPSRQCTRARGQVPFNVALAERVEAKVKARARAALERK